MKPRVRSSTQMVTSQRVVDVIEKSFSERLTLKTISVAVRAKASLTGHMFEAAVGETVHQYLTRVRLEHAVALIEAKVKIEAVALMVGYRSKKNFYRQFANHFGITPDTFRRRAHGSATRQGNGSPPTRYTGRFNGASCCIEVESRTNVKGRISYVATPMVSVAHGLQPFLAPAHIEIGGETETEAIERAAIFLEHRFGLRAAPLKRNPNGKAISIVRARR